VTVFEASRTWISSVNRPEEPPTGGAEPGIIVVPQRLNAIFDALECACGSTFTPERV